MWERRRLKEILGLETSSYSSSCSPTSFCQILATEPLFWQDGSRRRWGLWLVPSAAYGWQELWHTHTKVDYQLCEVRKSSAAWKHIERIFPPLFISMLLLQKEARSNKAMQSFIYPITVFEEILLIVWILPFSQFNLIVPCTM